METTQGQVKIGREFFSKIKLDYANWQWALVREFLQNCFDAPKVRTVEVTVESAGSDTLLTVRNDGMPMDREVLFGKLLTLGGSGKNFEGENTGGFGVAKSLLYYTHKSYSIRTGKFLVEGSGAQYQTTESGSYNGTESKVVLEGDVAEDLRQEVRKFASLAQWKGCLKLNGQELTCELKKGARRKDVGWGIIYTNNAFSNLCLVRINGQPMFSQYTRFKGTVLIELVGKAMDTLTSNRDALKYAYQSQLSDLLTALAIDKKSALKEQRAEYRRYRGEKQRNEAKQPKAVEGGLAAVGLTKDLGILLGGGATAPGGMGKQPGKTGPATVITEVPETANGGGGIKVVVASKEDEPDTTISVGPEFILKNCTGMKCPAYYTPGEQFSKYSRELVRSWTALLLKLYQLHNVSGEFSVGFVLDDESEAEHETGVYGRVYYINPVKVDESGTKRAIKPRYDGVWGSRFEIISVAAHEFVHGAYGLREHDEDYAGKLTDVMAMALRHYKELEELCKPIREATERIAGAPRTSLFGQPMTRVVMWMGKEGWSFEQAWDSLQAMNCQTTEASVRTFLRAGAKGERGEPATLTEQQAEELRLASSK